MIFHTLVPGMLNILVVEKRKKVKLFISMRVFLGTELSSWDGITWDRNIPGFPGTGKEGVFKAPDGTGRD